ncbi:unnamed protein product [Amoebophrya sp. A120]|nr:unnamed protein product [Amoebophrya sp. A120]|eukprot:GSA120T00021099001.1
MFSSSMKNSGDQDLLQPRRRANSAMNNTSLADGAAGSSKEDAQEYEMVELATMAEPLVADESSRITSRGVPIEIQAGSSSSATTARRTGGAQGASVLRLSPMSPVELGMLRNEQYPAELNYPKYAITPNAVFLLDEEDVVAKYGTRTPASSQEPQQTNKLLTEAMADFFWETVASKHARLRTVPDVETGKWKMETLAVGKSGMDWTYHMRFVEVEESTSSISATNPAVVPSEYTMHPAIEQKITSVLDHEDLDVTKPLWKAYVVRLKQNGKRSSSPAKDRKFCTTCLVVRMHHAVTDGVNGMKILDFFKNDLNERCDILQAAEAKFKSSRGGGRNNSKTEAASKQNFCFRFFRFILLIDLIFLPILKLIGFVFWLIFDVFRSIAATAYLPIRPLSTFSSFYPVRKDSSFVENMRYGPRKVVFFPVIPFEVVKALKTELKVTVNDVLMSCFAGAIGRFCGEVKRDENFLGGMREKATFQALIPCALPVKNRKDPQDQLLNNFTFLSTPLAVHEITNPEARTEASSNLSPGGARTAAADTLPIIQDTATSASTSLSRPEPTKAVNRVFFTQKIMNQFKTSLVGFVSLFLTQVTSRLLPAKQTAQQVGDIFLRHGLVFSNVPGYVVPVKTTGGSGTTINPSTTTLFPQTDSTKDNPAFRSLVVADGIKVKGIFVYFYNIQPQVILSSYQDKVFMTLVIDPTRHFKTVVEEDTFVKCYNEELYLLAEAVILRGNNGMLNRDNWTNNENLKLLELFLNQRPIPRM